MWHQRYPFSSGYDFQRQYEEEEKIEIDVSFYTLQSKKSDLKDDTLTVIQIPVASRKKRPFFVICGDYLCWLQPEEECTILYQKLEEFVQNGKT